MRTAVEVLERSQRAFMPEIQALRALAVGAVVLFHLWPSSLPGGYVGVDVFFVISGYLITSHLVREADRRGTVSLSQFYARRMRRLLPASLLVLVVAGVAGVVLLPPQFAVNAAHEVAASTFYVENLWLASKAVTYSASNDVASPVQHYWSLSAEEQFYLVWPALVIAGLAIGRRWLRGRTVTAVGLLLAVACVASLVHSIALTASDPAAAYFVTTTRAWEFGAGALTSMLLRRWAPVGAWKPALRWVGLAAVVATCFAITQRTPFPGWVALVPVLGTVAIIVAGPTSRRDPLERVVGLRPVQWLGDVSYSVYLWHWPLIALVPFGTGRPLSTLDKLGILLATGALAHASRRYVEQPFLKGSLATRRPAVTFLAMGVAMALIAGSALAYGQVVGRAAPARAPLASEDPCFGAEATLNSSECPRPFLEAPQGEVGPADSPWHPYCPDDCWDGTRPAKVMAIVGDSHAQTLTPALLPIARARGYELALFLQGGCPATYAASPTFAGNPRKDPAECRTKTLTLQEDIRKARPDIIVTSAYTGSTFASQEEATRGYHAVWDEWQAFAKLIVVVRDYPTTLGTNGPACLGQNRANPLACATPREASLRIDPAVEAARTYPGPVTVIDLSDAYCDDARCYPVVGGVPVYFDHDHITGTFASTLVGRLDRDLPAFP